MISLKKYKIDFEGPLEKVNKIPLEMVPAFIIKMYPTGYCYECNGRKFYGGTIIDEGIYGHVDEWIMEYNGNKELVYEKRCHNGGHCLLMEAAVQILVRDTLSRIGCQAMVSEIKQICRRENEITFMMEPFNKTQVIALHDACASALESVHSSAGAGAFDLWFVETLAQLILVMGYLEREININHRDLKGDNILINTTPIESTIMIQLNGFNWRLKYHNEIKIVDFGLACKGTAINKPGTLSVGEVFAGREICPKEGRDIYFLLCYFYGMTGFRQACSRRLLGMIERWIGPGKVIDALREDGLKKLPWINFLINTTEYCCKSATSAILLRDLAVEYPDILQAYK